MPTPPLSDEVLRHTLDVYRKYHRQRGKAAKALGIPKSTLDSRMLIIKARGFDKQREAPIQRPAWAIGEAEKPRIRVPARQLLSSGSRSVLIISDLHAPYQHPDALSFLSALNEKYRFDRVVSDGDELDYHAMSFHESDPDLDAAGRELQRGREVLWELERIFPKIDFVDSNHGSMVYRRAKSGGVPRHLILDYRDAIFGEKQEDGSVIRPNGRGDGWRWQQTLLLDLPHGQRCLVVHGMSISTRRNVEQSGMCFVQGHHHGTFEIVYNGTPDALNWGMTVGCLIDDHSLAFAYNRHSLKRPVIGCGAIIDGHPKLLPMVLAKGGRWSGFVP